MAEFSAIVAIQVDEAGRPTNLEAFQEGDTLASSVLTRGVRDVVTTVEDTSATWDAGGDPQIATYVRSASGDIESVSGSVASLTDGSGHWFSGFNYSLSAWETVSATSATWNEGGEATIPASVSGPWEDTFENVRDTSSLRDRVLTYVRDGSGSIGNTSSVVTTTSGNWNTIYGDRANIITTSANTIVNTSRTDDVVATSGSWNDTFTNVRDTSSLRDRVINFVRDGSGSIGNTSSVVTTTSGNWNTIYGDRTNIITTSANTIVNTSRTDDVVATSGSWDGTFENVRDTSSLRDRVIEYVRDGSGSIGNTSSVVTTTSGNWNDIYGDRANIISVSGSVDTSNTAFLTGATPTLDNTLDADGNNIENIALIKGRDPALTAFNLSGYNITLYHHTGAADGGILYGPIGDTSSLIANIGNLAGVSGTGGTGSFEGSATASALFCGNADDPASSIIISGCDPDDDINAVQDNGMFLSIDEANARMRWTTAPFAVNVDDGNIELGDGVGTNPTMAIAGTDIISRKLHASNSLSGASTCTTILDSSASISGCPYPPPFSFVRSTATLGAGVDNFYFGSGVTGDETTMGSDGISFDLTNGYWVIDSAGWYEVFAAIGINCTSSPSTIKNYVVTTAGYGGSEILKTFTTTVLRTNIDPHLTAAHWIGYLTAGIKLAIKCDTDAGLITSERYSTASVKRIG